MNKPAKVLLQLPFFFLQFLYQSCLIHVFSPGVCATFDREGLSLHRSLNLLIRHHPLILLDIFVCQFIISVLNISLTVRAVQCFLHVFWVTNTLPPKLVTPYVELSHWASSSEVLGSLLINSVWTVPKYICYTEQSDSYVVFIFEHHITQHSIVNRIIEELLLRDAEPVIIILDTVKLIHDFLQQVIINLFAENKIPYIFFLSLKGLLLPIYKTEWGFQNCFDFVIVQWISSLSKIVILQSCINTRIYLSIYLYIHLRIPGTPWSSGSFSNNNWTWDPNSITKWTLKLIDSTSLKPMKEPQAPDELVSSTLHTCDTNYHLIMWSDHTRWPHEVTTCVILTRSTVLWSSASPSRSCLRSSISVSFLAPMAVMYLK